VSESITTTNELETEETAFTAVAQAPVEEGQEPDTIIAQPIGQNGPEGNNTSDGSDNNQPAPDRTTIVITALIVSLVLLLSGGGVITWMLLKRSKGTRL
jgi:hypothetical protein